MGARKPATKAVQKARAPLPPVRARGAIDLGPLPELSGYLLRRAQIVVFQDFIAACAAFDIRPAQFSVLSIVAHNPGLRQAEVAGALGIKRTNFVALFRRLETRGLVMRGDAADRRSNALFLTPEGERVLRAVDERVAQHEKRVIGRLGAENRALFFDLLGRLAGLRD